MAERRHATRQKSFLRGCVYFNKRRGAMDCLIRDISADVGLAFTAAEGAAAAPGADDGDLARRVEKLETEIAALRRMLRQLKHELGGAGEDAA